MEHFSVYERLFGISKEESMAYHKMDQYINNQVRFWHQQKEEVEKIGKEAKAVPFVTISREYGAGGYEVAEKLVTMINEEYSPEPLWAAYDKDLLDKLSDDMGLSKPLSDTLTHDARTKITEFFQTFFSKFPPQVAVFQRLVENIKTLLLNGNVVIVGRAGRKIAKDMPGGFHVRIVAPLKWRIDRVSRVFGISEKEAEHVIADKTKKRESFLREFVNFDNTDPHNYHIVINMEEITAEEAAKMIYDGMKIRDII